MKLIFFEDQHYSDFDPLSSSHPVYMLLYGTSKVYWKWIAALKPDDYAFLCRPYLADILKWETGKEINFIPDGDTILINGRYLPATETISEIASLGVGEGLACGDDLLACRIGNGLKPPEVDDLLNLHEEGTVERTLNMMRIKKIDADSVKYLWDLIDGNGDLIRSEFAEFKVRPDFLKDIKENVSVIGSENIFISSSADIASTVVIDSSEGPVIIDDEAIVEPFSYIRGPGYIGPRCRIVGGKIRGGCSFGPDCRVGGEVEETIMLGFCNKYHEGFLGHAYIGEWVNLGALTANSDLKNNYANIRVAFKEKTVDTGSIKVGCFIGDHTKTGIGTMLNTGISIGFSCNLYGAGLFSDRRISPFRWGSPGELVQYRLDKAIETATRSMTRRGVEFTSAHGTLFSTISSMDS